MHLVSELDQPTKICLNKWHRIVESTLSVEKPALNWLGQRSNVVMMVRLLLRMQSGIFRLKSNWFACVCLIAQVCTRSSFDVNIANCERYYWNIWLPLSSTSNVRVNMFQSNIYFQSENIYVPDWMRKYANDLISLKFPWSNNNNFRVTWWHLVMYLYIYTYQ